MRDDDLDAKPFVSLGEVPSVGDVTVFSRKCVGLCTGLCNELKFLCASKPGVVAGVGFVDVTLLLLAASAFLIARPTALSFFFPCCATG